MHLFLSVSRGKGLCETGQGWYSSGPFPIVSGHRRLSWMGDGQRHPGGGGLMAAKAPFPGLLSKAKTQLAVVSGLFGRLTE